MNANEAKKILLRFRPGTVDADEPDVAEALAQAGSNPELAQWLAAQLAQQEALRVQFARITPPAALRAQIVSEYAAARRRTAVAWMGWVAVAAVVVFCLSLAVYWRPLPGPVAGDALAVFQSQMVRLATGGYAMDLATNDLAPVRAYLAARHAPADLSLPAPLQHALVAGCAVTDWHGAGVSLICFRTGRPLPPGTAADLWLFVVDQAAITNAPASGPPQIAKVNRLATATWTDGRRLYFLGVAGPEADLRRYL